MAWDVSSSSAAAYDNRLLILQFLPRANMAPSNDPLTTMWLPECIGCQFALSVAFEYLICSQVVLSKARDEAYPPAIVRMDHIWRYLQLIPIFSLSTAAEAGLQAHLQLSNAPLKLQVFFPLTFFTYFFYLIFFTSGVACKVMSARSSLIILTPLAPAAKESESGGESRDYHHLR